MPLRSLLVPALASLIVTGATLPASAEDGFFDRLLGGTPGAAPANPFASNYPSAAPTPDDVRAERAARRARRARDPEAGPVPPGRIPQE